MTTVPSALPSLPNASYPGFNVLLFGPSGTGKTYSLSTLVEAGLEVFVLFLEPGVESLIGAYSDANKAVPENLHYHYLQPATSGFDQLMKMADNVGKFDLAGLSKMKDIGRSQNNQLIDVYKVLNDFPDQRTGKTFGSVDSWGTNRVLVIDSLSALNRICLATVTGTKPVRDMSDWGIAQNLFMSLLHKLTSGCQCHFVLIAHIERETDQILGGVKLMVSALGRAITPQIPQPFSDVILSVREGTNYYWDTANSQADVKTRNLSASQKLPADFRPIYKRWAERAQSAKGV